MTDTLLTPLYTPPPLFVVHADRLTVAQVGLGTTLVIGLLVGLYNTRVRSALQAA